MSRYLEEPTTYIAAVDKDWLRGYRKNVSINHQTKIWNSIVLYNFLTDTLSRNQTYRLNRHTNASPNQEGDHRQEKPSAVPHTRTHTNTFPLNGYQIEITFGISFIIYFDIN